MRYQNFTALTAISLLMAWTTHAAVYNETGGQVVIEAEHFDARTTSATGRHWTIIPTESGMPDAPVDAGFVNARGDKYMQSLPDGGENRSGDTSLPGTGNVLDYKVQINTVGTYRLYLRWGGFDGSSDSLYAEIVELRDGITTGQADWYRFSANITGDFATAANTTTGGTAAGWNGSGAPAGSADQISGGPAGEVAATWTISEAGVYTIRISQREDGSALDALILQRTTLAEPTNPGPAESALATSYVFIAQPPQDTLAKPGQTATFTVVATGTGTLTYQWQKAAPGSTNFTDIAGATGTNYTTGTVTDADGGTQYRVVVSITGSSVRSRAGKLITDAIPPSVVGAFGGANLTNVTIRFSERVSQATAETLVNYTITGLTLSNPKLQANGTDVILATTAQTANTSYTITINGVTDLAGNAISNGQAKFTGATRATGGLSVALWFGITGTPLQGLFDDTRYPNMPEQTRYWPNFGPFAAGNNYGDNFGGQVTGWIVPPVTGNYKFYLRSDDAGQLYLSTDDKQANEALICEQTGCCNAFTDSEGILSSAPIALQAGKEYWVRGLYKEGGGDDYLQVGWRTPSDASLNTPPTGVIGGQYLRTIADPSATITITQQPTNTTVAGGASTTFSVRFTAFSAFGTNAAVQWQKAAAGSTNFADIAGAISADYTIQFANPADNGAMLRATVSSGNTSVNSAAATLAVTSDTTPPTVKSVSGSPTAVTVAFSEPLDTASATTRANYTISGGGNVTAATLTSGAGQAGVVVLTVTGLTAGQNYSLTVTGVKDQAGNTIASTTQGFDVFHINSTFNDGLVPAGAGLGGSANVKSSGSYDGSGFLELTANANSLQGAIIYGDVLSGGTVNKFTALFKMFIGRGTGNPADGFSFNMASDLPDPTSGTTTGEEGTGGGLTVSFDTYDNGGAEAPAFSVKWGQNEFVKTNVTKATMVNNQWVDVVIQVFADGTIDLTHNNVKYFSKEPVQGWSPITAPRVMMGARTGNENEVHWIDDFKVLYNADLFIAPPPTVTITSPANNARLPANSAVTITVNAQAPGSSVTKVEYFANSISLGSSTTAPFSFTVPNAPTGGYLLTARVTAATGVSVFSAPVKVVVGNPDVVYLVTADPGPLTFAGDQAVYERLLSRGYDVELARGSDVPDDGSTALGKKLIVQSSSLGSGTVEIADPAGGAVNVSKFKLLAIPAIEWEASNQDAYGFQGANGTTTAGQTQINIVDSASPLAAGFPNGLVTVSDSQPYSQGTPTGAHVVATLAADATQAVIYNYEKGDTGFNGFVMPARRVFFFFGDNTAAVATANGWKLFDAAVDWALNKTVTAAPQITSARVASGNVTVQWINGGTLESATSLASPITWTTTGNSSGSFSEATSGAGKFYRVRR